MKRFILTILLISLIGFASAVAEGGSCGYLSNEGPFCDSGLRCQNFGCYPDPNYDPCSQYSGCQVHNSQYNWCCPCGSSYSPSANSCVSDQSSDPCAQYSGDNVYIPQYDWCCPAAYPVFHPATSMCISSSYDSSEYCSVSGGYYWCDQGDVANCISSSSMWCCPSEFPVLSPYDNNYCWRSSWECTDDSHCSGNEVCSSNQCEIQLCTESWSCSSWTTCSNSQQTRTCTDSNSCGTTTLRPFTSQTCITQEACPFPWVYDSTYSTSVTDCVVWQYAAEFGHCNGGGWFVYHYETPELSSMTMTDIEYQSLAPQECYQTCNTDADTNCDTVVDRIELGVVINQWANNLVTRDKLGEAIVAWMG